MKDLFWAVPVDGSRQSEKSVASAGPVYILISRKFFSTTAEFCAVAHSNKRATFIGMSNRGRGLLHQRGEMILPNTKAKSMLGYVHADIIIRIFRRSIHFQNEGKKLGKRAYFQVHFLIPP
ncbi:S41 family peptidase [Siphonobacter sp.]|uniref:S41 family peptidase n=1 Tax=Siphonobacter sp. TaxID=1869184 RepID=UPI003B3B454E